MSLDRRRVAQRLAQNWNGLFRRASRCCREAHFVDRALLLANGDNRRVPDFQRQRPVIEGGFPRSLIEVENVDLSWILDLQCADTNLICAPWRKLRRIRGRNAEKYIGGRRRLCPTGRNQDK